MESKRFRSIFGGTPDSREVRAALVKNMRISCVIRVLRETGGSASLNGTTDWSGLVPLCKTAKYRVWQN